MIYIAGLGIAGSYLGARLVNSGFEVTAYDPRRDNYYLPCGYATNERYLLSYLSNLGLNLEEYVLSRAENITFSGHNFSGVSFGSRGMCTIDKKRMEEDMARDIPCSSPDSLEKSSIAIDATGISRALLGKHPEDYQMFAKEYLASKSEHTDFYFHYFEKGHGYYWEFPLGKKFHIGAGSDNMDMVDDRLSTIEHELVTGRKIRLTPLFDSVSKGKVIGVGEAIGTVSPITGEGILPSLKSAEMLFQAINHYSNLDEIVERYRDDLLKDLGYYKKIRNIVKKIQAGEKFSLRDVVSARSAAQDLKQFGVDFKISRVISHFI